MKKTYLIMSLAAVLLCSCKGKQLPPRPTIPLVETIISDTSGLARLPALAGHQGATGSIAIIGDPADGIRLARLFQSVDAMDNIDGRAVRDSLPDFAGEQFDIILDIANAPYSHYIPEKPDSLREAAVKGAMFAWDSTCLKNTSHTARKLLKSKAKILVFSSPLHSACGLFDVDTLQQLAGGASKIVSPVETMLKDAVMSGAQNIGVWATREERAVKAYEEAYAALGASGSVTAISPDAALDVRTQLRSFLRQWRTTDKQLDAIVISDYSVNTKPLYSEIEMIRKGGTEEDQAFSKVLSPDFVIIDPGTSLTKALFSYMREENLFTHRIARPAVRYYETTESEEGESVIVEVGQSYVHSAYVQDFD